MNIPILIVGLLTLALAGTLAAISAGQYLALEQRRLPGASSAFHWNWFERTNPANFASEVRPLVRKMRRLTAMSVLVLVIAVVLLWVAFG